MMILIRIFTFIYMSSEHGVAMCAAKREQDHYVVSDICSDVQKPQFNTVKINRLRGQKDQKRQPHKMTIEVK